MTVKSIKDWRKQHQEPGQTRSLTRDTAALIIGLTPSGYDQQRSGTRRLSRQTARLMAAWDLMPADLRARYLDIAKAIDADLVKTGEGEAEPG
jgi:hypothetical protein